ncbi:MAG: LLM class flavin-dependent oxidoreductase [Chloroflexi bacterium]|nr:LLM class flavin-dependent oxidoreductase [Chloroflexota bacterium]
MKISFAVGLPPEDPQDFIRWVKSAEGTGFDMVVTGDSPAIFREQYVALTLMALNTKTCRIGNFITNPLTRHLVVTTSGISSIHELSGGRAYLGISTGDSGVYNLGMKAATLAHLEEYITAMRQLWKNTEAVYKGQTVRFMWYNKPVPVYMSAGGPKSLRLAGRIADGVFIETGILPEVIKDSIAQVKAGAAEAGRKLEDIDLWWYIKGNLGPSVEAAAEKIRSGLASSANHSFRFTLEGKFVPDHLRDKIESLKRQYVFHQHVQLGEHVRNAQLVDELGLREYLIERFAICGTPQDWVKRINELAQLGVRKLALAGVMPEKEKFFDTLGREVIAKFQR